MLCFFFSSGFAQDVDPFDHNRDPCHNILLSNLFRFRNGCLKDSMGTGHNINHLYGSYKQRSRTILQIGKLSTNREDLKESTLAKIGTAALPSRHK